MSILETFLKGHDLKLYQHWNKLHLKNIKIELFRNIAVCIYSFKSLEYNFLFNEICFKD